MVKMTDLKEDWIEMRSKLQQQLKMLAKPDGLTAKPEDDSLKSGNLAAET